MSEKILKSRGPAEPVEPVKGSKGPETGPTPLKQLKCPQCGAGGAEITKGNNGDLNNICKKCGKEFKTSDKSKKDIITGDLNESIIIFKSPEVLLTLNQMIHRSKFEKSLDEAISESFGRNPPRKRKVGDVMKGVSCSCGSKWGTSGTVDHDIVGIEPDGTMVLRCVGCGKNKLIKPRVNIPTSPARIEKTY